MSNSKRFFILSGPSGVGKTTLFHILEKKEPRICKTISLTTRSARHGEVDGIDYIFVSKTDFLKHQQSGDLVEWNEHNGVFYGTLISQLENANSEFVFLIIDTEGAKQVRKKIESVTIFIMPPSIEELERRLRNRASEPESEISARLLRADKEIKNSFKYDHVLVCDDLESCSKKLHDIVLGIFI